MSEVNNTIIQILTVHQTDVYNERYQQGGKRASTCITIITHIRRSKVSKEV